MNFWARRAVTAAQQLEQLGREQAFDAVDQVHQELEAAWSELERDLNAQLR
jgi:HPt (histidine-containing phosphotransfer) domain-containing protein